MLKTDVLKSAKITPILLDLSKQLVIIIIINIQDAYPISIIIIESCSSEILASKVGTTMSVFSLRVNSPITTLLCDHEIIYVLIVAYRCIINYLIIYISVMLLMIYIKI